MINLECLIEKISLVSKYARIELFIMISKVFRVKKARVWTIGDLIYSIQPLGKLYNLQINVKNFLEKLVESNHGLIQNLTLFIQLSKKGAKVRESKITLYV
jgi:hypothetical protein